MPRSNGYHDAMIAPKLIAAGLLLLCAASHADLCESGKRQSPIDITSSQRQNLPALIFDYTLPAEKIANDKHTVRVRFSAGNQVRFGALRFTLQQFHFHTPGGDRIAGEEFPMVAHLLHKSASGQLLALAVPFRTGAENPLLEKLLPLIPSRADGDHPLQNDLLLASALLPAQRGYYRYSGSLTAPPCTEGFDWIVLKQAIEISPAQLARYRQHFGDNMRAPQALHGRVVLESE
jgi:carbonic anhydrase